MFELDCNCRGRSIFVRKNAFLYTINKLRIDIDDQVDDGCFPSPRSAEVTIEAELRRNGISISDTEFSPSINLFALGTNLTIHFALYTSELI